MYQFYMDNITNYFNAEKSESLLFILVGIISISVSVYFILQIKQPFYNGMCWPLIAIAFIQITVGTSVYFRSPKDIQRVTSIIQTEKEKISSEEIPRMQVVMKNFIIYRYVEIVLLVSGLLLMFLFDQSFFLKGIGIGLFIQSAFMLSLDFFAEKRGQDYLDFLQGIR